MPICRKEKLNTTNTLWSIHMASKGDKPESGDGSHQFDLFDPVRIADQVPESEHLIEPSEVNRLLSHVYQEVGDSLIAVAVYNSSTIEYHSYTPERLAQYSQEELEALSEDRLLQIRREDKIQEDLYKLQNYQYKIDGYKNGILLRIRFTSSTGVIIVTRTCAEITLPEFPTRLINEVNLDITDGRSSYEDY